MTYTQRATGTPYERALAHSTRADNGCLEYTAHRNHYGYGDLGKAGRAHRIAWEHHNGPIPSGMSVCHHCDNPPCFEIEHLFLGTPADNSLDAKIKGRMRSPEGWDNSNTRLSPEQVVEIRTRYEQRKFGDIKVIAQEYHITPEQVWRIGTGRRRANV